jgi:hypothetical protein
MLCATQHDPIAAGLRKTHLALKNGIAFELVFPGADGWWA